MELEILAANIMGDSRALWDSRRDGEDPRKVGILAIWKPGKRV